MLRIGLQIEALDTLFFRDGRPFIQRAESALPTPQTLTGAVRTWFLKALDCDFELLKQDIHAGLSWSEALAEQELEAVAQIRLQGPWLNRLSDPQQVFLPVPASLCRSKKSILPEIHYLRPKRQPLPGWSPPWPGLKPLWLPQKKQLENLSGFISLQGMSQFLAGQVPDSREIFAADQLYQFEERTGIGIQAQSQSAEDGMIYAVRLLRLLPDMGFYAKIELPEQLKPHLPQENWIFPWGGEGCRVVAQHISPVTWPKSQPRKQGSQCCVLTTPMLTASPDFIQGLQPKALALLPWQPISGWDLALGGPKPLRWLLPAGSVLYFSDDHIIPALCPPDVAQMGWGVTLEGFSDDVE